MSCAIIEVISARATSQNRFLFELTVKILSGTSLRSNAPNDRPDPVGRLHLAAERRRDRHVPADLHDVHVEPFFAKEAPLLGDVEIDRGDASAGNRKNDFLIAGSRRPRGCPDGKKGSIQNKPQGGSLV